MWYKSFSENKCFERSEMFLKYVSSIKHYQVIPDDEINKLISEINSTNDKKEKERLRNKIVKANQRIIISVASNYATTSGVDIMDLIQEGQFGLVDAIEKFNPEKNMRFSTYAVNWITTYLRRYIYNIPTIYKPGSQRVASVITRCTDKLLQMYSGYVPEDELFEMVNKELGKKFALPKKEDLYALQMLSTNLDSENDDINYAADKLITESAYGYDSSEGSDTSKSDAVVLVNHAMQYIKKESDKEFIKKLYGIGLPLPESYESLASYYGITIQGVKNREARILVQMRRDSIAESEA